MATIAFYRVPEVAFYPLRPELAESTYMLYRATRNPFYLHVGREMLQSLNTFTRVRCGYATVHSVLDKSLEDRMESFFLSETTKYLYLVSTAVYNYFICMYLYWTFKRSCWLFLSHQPSSMILFFHLLT